MLAVLGFFKDYAEIETFVMFAWMHYRDGRLNLMAASVTTDTAYGMLKRSSEDLLATTSGKKKTYWDIVSLFADDKVDNGAEMNGSLSLDVAQSLAIPVEDILSDFASILKPNVAPIYNGQYGYYRPDENLKKKTGQQQHLQDKQLLFEYLPEIAKMTKANLRMPAEDELTTGLRGMMETNNISACPMYVIFATKLFLTVKSFRKWQNTTVTDLRASILQFAITLCHEFAHALAAITQNGPRIPRFNEECVVETGFSWEQYVFGGVAMANPDDSTDLWLSPWPFYEGWKSCADDGDTLQLWFFSRGALPLQQAYPVQSQMWQRFFEQGFWERADRAQGAFKKLWLRGNEVFYSKDHFAVLDQFSAPPEQKRECPDEEERQRRRMDAIWEKRNQAMEGRPGRWDRIVDKAKERREAFHESQGKLLLADFWESCTRHCDQNVFL